MKHILSFFILCFFILSAEAKLFQNSYVSFEIPETWSCKAFGTDWVCHSKFQAKKAEALITTTAKIAGSLDTLEQYQNYLQQPKTWYNLNKEQIISKKITSAKKVFINKFSWVDSIHKNSEVKSYISRYVGTICCEGSSSKLGILLVLSAHQDHYTKYSSEFVKTVNSLKVLNIEKAIPKIRGAQATGAGAGMNNYMDDLFENEAGADLVDGGGDANKIFGMDPLQLSLIGLLALGGISYFFVRSRRRRKKRRHKNR